MVSPSFLTMDEGYACMFSSLKKKWQVYAQSVTPSNEKSCPCHCAFVN